LWSKLNIYLVKYICGVNYKVTGLKNISSNAVIIASNHQSAWETLFFQTLFSKQTWILKKDLLKIPFFGWGLRLLDPIAIDRKNKIQSLKFIIHKGRKKLINGWNIIYFPQGTRVAPNKRIKLSSGVFMLAKNSNFPILPIVHNAGVFWPKNSFFKYPGTICIKIGKPVYNSTNVINSKKNLENWMNENYSLFNNT
jgi:1-acyl-sn-glycerol-3-phosphate acyltransferase